MDIPKYKNWHQKQQDALSPVDRIADAITRFAGTMQFLFIHFVWWGGWFVINSNFLHIKFDPYPYSLLTMVLSLEAIVLSTLIMISQNRQAERDKIQAQHQYEHQERELAVNTKLTREIHELVTIVNNVVSKNGNTE